MDYDLRRHLLAEIMLPLSVTLPDYKVTDRGSHLYVAHPSGRLLMVFADQESWSIIDVSNLREARAYYNHPDTMGQIKAAVDFLLSRGD